MEQIKDIISYVTVDAIGFADEWMHSQHSQREKELRKVEKRLTQARKRCDEIDNLLMRTYEDYANGILSLERYQKMSAILEQEQAALNEEIASLDKKVRRHEEISDDFDRFIELVGKYTDITELTPTIVNEFIKKIFVHEADNSTGKRTQQIEIIFNFIGDLVIPAANQTIDSAKDADEKIA